MPFSKATFCPSEPFMARAIELARNGRGPTAPNPCVGAVLMHDGHILAEGWHTRYGAPHAERECLARAKQQGVFKRVDPADCTMFVTLEPCNHHGKTPPCSEALIEAGIGTVVIGAADPTAQAAGGADTLRKGGVTVLSGVMQQQCEDLVADFRVWQQTKRPYTIVKMAATLDGKIASAAGKPEPVSCAESFAHVHELRSLANAIIVGGGTFRADNPSLTCRLETVSAGVSQPLAVVVTSQLPAPNEPYTLLQQRPEQVIFWTSEEAALSPKADGLRSCGATVLGLPLGPYGLDFLPGFTMLRTQRSCHYCLCEGGGHLAMALVQQNLADELIHFVTPRILGDEAAPSAYAGRTGVSIAETVDFRVSSVEPRGRDIMVTLLR